MKGKIERKVTSLWGTGVICGQAVSEVVGRRMNDVGGRRLREGGTKNTAEEFYYRGGFRTDKVLKCLVLKELELTVKDTPRWKLVSGRMLSSDAPQRKRNAELEMRVESSEEKPGVSKSSLREKKSRKKKKRGRGSESNGETSNRKVIWPKVPTG